MNGDVEWRPVPGWEGWYEVSDDGRVRSVDRVVITRNGRRLHWRGRERKAVLYRGYPRVGLHRPGEHKITPVHHMVLWAFVGPCPQGHETLHRDGDPTNAHLSNLRWGSKSENAQDALRHGTSMAARYAAREVCRRNHRLVEPNLDAGALAQGYRRCRACHRAENAARYRPMLDLQIESDRQHEALLADVQAVVRKLG